MRLKETKVIALANQKGGCGKTTTSVSLAAALAQEGLSVCLVDVDSQCNATDNFGLNRTQLAQEGRLTIADAYLGKKACKELEFHFGDRFGGNLTLVPGHRGLEAVPPRLEAQLHVATCKHNHPNLQT